MPARPTKQHLSFGGRHDGLFPGDALVRYWSKLLLSRSKENLTSWPSKPRYLNKMVKDMEGDWAEATITPPWL